VNSTAVENLTAEKIEPAATGRLIGVQRFAAVTVAAIVAAGLPYLWVLWYQWTGTVNPLRTNGSDDLPIYDAQARAMLHGHLSLANHSIGAEAFIHDGRQYTILGIFPSVLRMPVFLFTNSLDGRFTSLSLLGAWIVTAIFSSLLLWRLRILLRGEAPLGWSEAVSYGVLIATILVGSVLVYLASIPDAYGEDEAWSVALACAALFALVGVIERPSWRRVTVCGFIVLLTDLNRATTGYAAVLAVFLIAIWFGLGRAGPERRRWALPMAIAGLVAVAIGCAVDVAKFSVLFGVPEREYSLGAYLGFNKLNGGQYFGLRYLPSTVQAYLDPANFRVTSIFPYITLPDKPANPIAHTTLFQRAPTANVLLSMPLLFASGVWGLITAFRPGASTQLRGLRILLVTSAATVGAMMIYGWILERYVADFLPLFLLGGMIGMVDVWRRLHGRSRRMRSLVPAVIGVVALFGAWVNIGYALAPTANWNRTQLSNYLNTQRTLSDATGHPLDTYIVHGKSLPSSAPTGTLFVQGRCTKVYLALQAVRPASNAFASFFNSPWKLVERAPDTPLCRSLTNGNKSVRSRGVRSNGRRVVVRSSRTSSSVIAQ
jgi:hypothetical protein